MSNNILIDLYNAVKRTLEGIQHNGEALFKFVGHYNTQELNQQNEFSFRTPAVFIGLDQVDWHWTKHDMDSQNATREEDGTVRFSLHYFIHDLRTDTNTFTDHLEIVTLAYQHILGLRSSPLIEGKFSSIQRKQDRETFNFNNLRHWIQIYQCHVQQPAIEAGMAETLVTDFLINVEETLPTFFKISEDILVPSGQNPRILIDGSGNNKLKING